MILLKSFCCYTILQTKTPLYSSTNIPFGPFNSCSQKRWKKPVDSAQTRLENRTRDLTLDKLMTRHKKLQTILKFHQLMSTRKRGPFVSLQLMSRWKNLVELNVNVGAFVHKYPHVFEVFTHPLRRNLCCKFTQKMRDLIDEEEAAIRDRELDAVRRLKKLLMMSKNGTLHVHALGLIRRELGLPKDFRESILGKYSRDFRLVNLEIVELVDSEESLREADIEKWREKEYQEKWLSEYETRYAFPINFPTGLKIEKGFREKLKNWQRLPYCKPYERSEAIRVRSCGGIERFEKRAVGMIHELLSLTVEKMVEVERLAHFRKDFCMEVNIRELLLKHPGIFYISTKGNTQMVFLREADNKGCLFEVNPIYVVRRKMLDLVLLGCRNTTKLQPRQEVEDQSKTVGVQAGTKSAEEGYWVIPIFESLDNEDSRDDEAEISDSS